MPFIALVRSFIQLHIIFIYAEKRIKGINTVLSHFSDVLSHKDFILTRLQSGSTENSLQITISFQKYVLNIYIYIAAYIVVLTVVLTAVLCVCSHHFNFLSSFCSSTTLLFTNLEKIP